MASISGATNSRASAVGIFVRFSACLIASTGVGTAGVGCLGATGTPEVACGQVEQVRIADDREVSVERLDRVGETWLEQQWIGHLDITPTPEAAVVVHRHTPRIAGS